MATKFNPEKKVDLPPTGNRNADPITDGQARIPLKQASAPRRQRCRAAWPSVRLRAQLDRHRRRGRCRGRRIRRQGRG